MDVSAEQLAREFSNSLKKILSKAEIVELVRRNREEISPNICHSHDFCDANMALHEVFMGHGMDIADEGEGALGSYLGRDRIWRNPRSFGWPNDFMGVFRGKKVAIQQDCLSLLKSLAATSPGFQ